MEVAEIVDEGFRSLGQEVPLAADHDRVDLWAEQREAFLQGDAHCRLVPPRRLEELAVAPDLVWPARLPVDAEFGRPDAPSDQGRTVLIEEMLDVAAAGLGRAGMDDGPQLRVARSATLAGAWGRAGRYWA